MYFLDSEPNTENIEVYQLNPSTLEPLTLPAVYPDDTCTHDKCSFPLSVSTEGLYLCIFTLLAQYTCVKHYNIHQ